MIKIGTYTFELNSFWKVLLYIVLVTFIAWVISRILRRIIIIFINRKKTDRYGRTSIQFFKNSIKFFIGLFALAYIIITVPMFRSKAALIFSGAGILAAIIGFAAQAALSNLIAGAFIVMFKPFRVGDYIKLDDLRTGIVEDITLRHTVINNFENKRLIIPNSIISTESVLNHTIDDSHVLSFNNFRVGLKANIDLARKIILEEAEKLDGTFNFNASSSSSTTSETEVRVIDINDSFIHLRAYVWLNEPFREFKIKCDFREAVHKRFVAEGVDLPIKITEVIKHE